MNYLARLLRVTAVSACAMVAMAAIQECAAADLGVYVAPTPYAGPPSPCVQYEGMAHDALSALRQSARLYHRQVEVFHRLKWQHVNDGFTGPDISLNAEMTLVQIDVETQAVHVTTSVAEARRLRCAPLYRLNLLDNEASRLRHSVVEDAIWIDPLTFR